MREVATLARSSQLDSLIGALRRTDIPAAEAIRNTDLALRTFRRLGLPDDDDVLNLRVLPAIAESYELLGGLEKALSVYDECLAASLRLQDRSASADLLWKMGRVQRKRNRWDDALLRLSESRSIHEDLENPPGVARCRITEANVAWERGDLATAGDSFRQALETGDQIDDRRIVADATNNLGILSTIQGDFDVAEVYYQNALVSCP
jgi:tetratricopeptide (TPR) repeat protein